MINLGEALLKAGVVTQEDIEAAKQREAETERHLKEAEKKEQKLTKLLQYYPTAVVLEMGRAVKRHGNWILPLEALEVMEDIILKTKPGDRSYTAIQLWKAYLKAALKEVNKDG